MASPGYQQTESIKKLLILGFCRSSKLDIEIECILYSNTLPHMRALFASIGQCSASPFHM